MKEYAVVYESGKQNWSAYVPDLPGCIATGKTLEATKAMIAEAIEFHIEGMRSRGELVPPPTTFAGTVRVSA
jgi:predicted RNase H-like HicB family nuclease